MPDSKGCETNSDEQAAGAEYDGGFDFLTAEILWIEGISAGFPIRPVAANDRKVLDLVS